MDGRARSRLRQVRVMNDRGCCSVMMRLVFHSNVGTGAGFVLTRYEAVTAATQNVADPAGTSETRRAEPA